MEDLYQYIYLNDVKITDNKELITPNDSDFVFNSTDQVINHAIYSLPKLYNGQNNDIVLEYKFKYNDNEIIIAKFYIYTKLGKYYLAMNIDGLIHGFLHIIITPYGITYKELNYNSNKDIRDYFIEKNIEIYRILHPGVLEKEEQEISEQQKLYEEEIAKSAQKIMQNSKEAYERRLQSQQYQRDIQNRDKLIESNKQSAVKRGENIDKLPINATVCNFIYVNNTLIKNDILCDTHGRFIKVILSDIYNIIIDKYSKLIHNKVNTLEHLKENNLSQYFYNTIFNETRADIKYDEADFTKLVYDTLTMEANYVYKFILNDNIIDIATFSINKGKRDWYINGMVNDKTYPIYKIIYKDNIFGLSNEKLNDTFTNDIKAIYMQCRAIIDPLIQVTINENAQLSAAKKAQIAAEEKVRIAKEAADKERLEAEKAVAEKARKDAAENERREAEKRAQREHDATVQMVRDSIRRDERIKRIKIAGILILGILVIIAWILGILWYNGKL